jgi:acylphosphatase
MPAAEIVCVRARIEGHVQGVSYRAWTVQEARAHGLSGWVRNRSDGSVEALFRGPAPAVDGMVVACRHGPPMARVTTVVTTPGDGEPETLGFRQFPTL